MSGSKVTLSAAGTMTTPAWGSYQEPPTKKRLHFIVLKSEQGCDEEENASVGEMYWKARNCFFSASFADRQRERKTFAGFRRGETHH